MNRNGLIVSSRTVYLITRNFFKILMDMSPLVKRNIQTKMVYTIQNCVATLVELIQ